MDELQIVHVANLMCYKLHVLQAVSVTICNCRKLHMLQRERIILKLIQDIFQPKLKNLFKPFFKESLKT